MKFILCADLHLRQDRPRCRTDEDWIKTQKEQIDMISSTAKEKNLPVVICGDIFHRPQSPDFLKTMLLRAFEGVDIHILAGQHDLPYHSWQRVDASSFGILWQMKGTMNIHSLLSMGSYEHYGQRIEKSSSGDCLFVHRLIFDHKKSIPPNVNAFSAGEILKDNPNYKWVFSGDNHHGFHYTEKNRHVIMAGSMNRQSIDMKDFPPRIWIIDTETDEVDVEYIPDSLELLVDDEFYKEAENRKDRLEAFIEQVKGAKSISLDYIENVREALKENDFTEIEKNTIYELLEV